MSGTPGPSRLSAKGSFKPGTGNLDKMLSVSWGGSYHRNTTAIQPRGWGEVPLVTSRQSQDSPGTTWLPAYRGDKPSMGLLMTPLDWVLSQGNCPQELTLPR